MNTWTRIGLVLLRVAIGWHFFFEGVYKLESWESGPREGQPEWSAAGYLSEAQGPLAPWFRQQAGEPDKDALAKLTLPKEPGKLPPVVEKQWADQFATFTENYQVGKDKAVQPEYVGIWAVTTVAPFPAGVPWPALGRGLGKAKPEDAQLALAQGDFELARQLTLVWFVKGVREVPSKLPGVSEKVKETTPERIAAYKKKLQQLDEIEDIGMPAFDRDVWKDNYKALKKEIATMRVELLRDLDKPLVNALAVGKFRLSKAQGDRSVPQPPAVTTTVDRVNFATRWGLTIVGVCMLLGLFTRTACVAGAGFLLLVILAMPSLPWLPLSPRSEGHYLFIDKNVIELIAMLTLATTHSGRWLGLDGLVQFFKPSRWRSAKTPAPARRPQPVA